jgi:hypothetical protein
MVVVVVVVVVVVPRQVWIVVNRDLQEKYRAKKSELTAAGSDVNEVLAFHGTSRPSIEGIAKTGFLPPTKLPSEKDSNSGGGGGKKPAKAAASYKVVKNKKKKITTTTSKSKNKKKVVVSEEEELDITVLDDGFFGKGIYFSIYSDYAMWYSEERQSDQILLCKVTHTRHTHDTHTTHDTHARAHICGAGVEGQVVSVRRADGRSGPQARLRLALLAQGK